MTDTAELIAEAELYFAARGSSGARDFALEQRLLAALREADERIAYLSSVLVERLLAGRTTQGASRNAYERAAAERIDADTTEIGRLRDRLLRMEVLLEDVRQVLTDGSGARDESTARSLIARIDALAKTSSSVTPDRKAASAG